MNFEKFNSIKSKIEKLPNVKFYSFNEDTLIIEHSKNKALYQIPFIMESDDTITLQLGKGQLVKEGEPSFEKKVQTYKEELRSDIKSMFVNYDEGLKATKEKFKTLPNIEEGMKAQPKKTLSLKDKIDILCEHNLEPIKNINRAFKNQLLELDKEKKEFVELMNPFNEDNSLKTHNLNYDRYKNMYVESFVEHNKFSEKMKKVADFNKKVNEIVKDDKLTKEFIKRINFDEDIKISVPKALINTKAVLTEDEFGLNIPEVSKKVIGIYNESCGVGDEAPFVYNRNIGAPDGAPQFLKFSSGKFTQQDVGTLLHELEQSYYILPDLTHEDLMVIADWRNQCEYMFQTNMISDKKIEEIIKSFNDKFSVDNDARFADGDNTLGFKDSEEMSMGNAEGFAYDGSTVKEDPYIDDTEYEDEFDNFETIEEI